MSEPEEILRDGIAEGLHLGGQLFVSLNGETILDVAVGEAKPGRTMTPDSIMPWFSSGKPLTAMAFAQLVERGLVKVEARVAEIIPEFGSLGKADLTFEHLLTHTAGFRSADSIPADTAWTEVIARICATPLEPDWAPGEKGGYSTTASWCVLGETIQRLTGRSLDEHLKEELLSPLGMNDTSLRLPADEFVRVENRLAIMHASARGAVQPLPLQDAGGLAILRPGSSARGPVRDLARFYEMLLKRGSLNGHQLLRPETVARFTSRHRAGLYDHTFLHTVDFGLGFVLNSNRYGAGTVPYGYGLHASDAAFGHSGAQGSCAFADPAHQLVVAWAVNGQPGERRHQMRQRALNTAIYEYWGLAGAG